MDYFNRAKAKISFHGPGGKSCSSGCQSEYTKYGKTRRELRRTTRRKLKQQLHKDTSNTDPMTRMRMPVNSL